MRGYNLGFKWEETEHGKECFMTCDNCGYQIREISVFSLNIPELTEYMTRNNWFRVDGTKKNDYRNKDYCNSCAVALGYIK